jgi:5-methylcytosine-specific restriction enzyme subunit McrC
MTASGRRVIQLREYERIPYTELGESTVQALERSAELMGGQPFRFYRKALQAQNFVGFFSAKDKTVQVLPKISDEDGSNFVLLTCLLSYVRRLRLRTTGISEYDKLQGSLLEIWICQFAEELNWLLRRELRKEYLVKDLEQSFVKGKLLFERMLRGDSDFSGKYHCRFDDFTPDYILNQLLKWANRLLLSQSKVASTIALLRENQVLLSPVEDRFFNGADVDRIHLNRLNRHYEPLLAICKLLLSGSTLDFRAGRISRISVAFDMNKLFEEFVAEFLKRNHSQLHLPEHRKIVAVESQSYLGRLFGEFRMVVDLVLTESSGRRILLDTKYKLLDTEGSHVGLSEADFYQMFGYARAGKMDYDEIILLYPRKQEQTSAIEREYECDGLKLKVRQIDLSKFVVFESGKLNVQGGLSELSKALGA